MFGLSGNPSLPTGGDLLGLLLVVALLVVLWRSSALGGRPVTQQDRERGWKLGVGMIVAWVGFVVVVAAVGGARLLPLLFQP